MLHIVSLIAFPVFLLSLLTLGLRGSLCSSAPTVIACQAIGLAVMIWGRSSFPRGSFSFGSAPTGPAIVRTGLYRFVRHPIYAGAFLILWGSIAGHPSLANAGIGLFATLLTVGKIVREERLLRDSVPGYTEYARSTKALVPFVL